MFVPQTQSHHLSRSYGARGHDKENAGVLPSKTPVRSGLAKSGPSTVGRPLGAKTPGMLGKTPGVLGQKTPGVLGQKTPGVLGTKNIERNIPQSKQPADDIGPKRLFQKSQPVQAGPSKAHQTPGRSLRTPAPRRVEAPTPAPLPSAQRTRRRSRASLQQNTPPAWEEEASLDSILEAEIDVPAVSVPHEDSDAEVEYAGATAVDRPYVPEWFSSIPDPVQTMARLAKMPPLMPPLPRSPPRTTFDDVEMPKIQLCSDDELEHPLFRRKPAKVEGGVRRPLGSVTNRLAVSANPGSKPARRPAADGPLAKSTAGTKPTRPASTASVRTTASSSRTTVRSGTRPTSAASSLRQPGNAAPRLPRAPSSRTSGSSIRSSTSAPRPAPRAAPRLAIPSPEPPALDDELLDLDFGVLDVDTVALPPIEQLSVSSSADPASK